jgi:hypothetical protein
MDKYLSGYFFNDYRTLISKAEYYGAPLPFSKVAIAAAREEMDPKLSSVKAWKLKDH